VKDYCLLVWAESGPGENKGENTEEATPLGTAPLKGQLFQEKNRKPNHHHSPPPPLSPPCPANTVKTSLSFLGTANYANY
jgi:hypothetical protein